MSSGSSTSQEDRRVRAVLDANVLFSALALPKDSPPSRVLGLVLAGKISAFVSPFILEELTRALSAKAGWDGERIQALLKRLRLLMTVVEREERVSAVKGSAADNRILGCALAARAEVLVTGNMKHLRPLGMLRGMRILTPKEFLSVLPNGLP